MNYKKCLALTSPLGGGGKEKLKVTGSLLVSSLKSPLSLFDLFSFGVRSELADSVVRKIPNPEKIYREINLNIFHFKLYKARPDIHSG